MNRVLVTGAGGFIGSRLTQFLALKGYDVTALDIGFDCLPEETQKRVNLVAHHLSVLWGQFLHLKDVDTVFHLASLSQAHMEQNPEAYGEQVANDFNLLRTCKLMGVKRVILASSSAVYGVPTQWPTDESHPCLPITLYGLAKMQMEQVARVLELHYVALRLFQVYGTGQTHGALAEWRRAIDAGQVPVIHGDGTQTIDLVHAADVVGAMVAAAKASRVEGQAINIGSGYATRIDRLASTVMGNDQPVQDMPESVPRVMWQCADIEKAHRVLGWQPKVSLQDGLRGWREKRQL